MEKKIYKLSIEPKFESLIPPLSEDEFELLEDNIKRDGCREPICVWDGTIVDGHNRYKICVKNQIPFFIQEMIFESKEEIITWICGNQLGRRNISEITRKYLIGKRYQTEKIINKHKNKIGKNQYSCELSKNKSTIAKTANEIAKKYSISEATVRRYAQYSNMVDKLTLNTPELISKVFNGKIKIPYKDIRKSSQKCENNFCKPEVSKIHIKNDNYNSETKCSEKNIANNFKVKELPKYDPDADISSLTYTIPSWVSSIERTFNLVEFEKISNFAKNKACEELKKLKNTIDAMLETMEDL